MKTRLLTGVVCAMIAIGFGGTTLMADPDFPLTFNPKIVDCGIVYDTSRVLTFSVPYTNNSKAAVTISQFVASCGCSKVSFTKAQLAPGEAGQVNITVNPFGKRDNFVVTILAQGSGREDVLGVLKVAGLVSEIARVSPSLVVCRAPVRAISMSAQLDSSIYLAANAGDWTLSSTNIDDPSKQIIASSTDPERDVNGIRQIDTHLQVKFKDDPLTVPVKAKIDYIFTSGQEKAKNRRAEFHLLQDVLILPDSQITCFPSTVNFLCLDENESLQKTIAISNPGKAKLGASSTLASLHLALQNPDQGSARLTVGLGAPVPNQGLQGKINITDAAGELLASIPVTVTRFSLPK